MLAATPEVEIEGADMEAAMKDVAIVSFIIIWRQLVSSWLETKIESVDLWQQWMSLKSREILDKQVKLFGMSNHILTA